MSLAPKPFDVLRAGRMRGFIPIALLIMVTGVACDKTPETTTQPSVPVITDTFSGTVAIGGSSAHNFTVTQPGKVEVTLTTAGPPPTIFMGLGVGVPIPSACTLLSGASANVQAGPAAQLSGTVSAGAFCLQVYDVGNQAAPITYTVTVSHP